MKLCMSAVHCSCMGPCIQRHRCGRRRGSGSSPCHMGQLLRLRDLSEVPHIKFIPTYEYMTLLFLSFVAMPGLCCPLCVTWAGLQQIVWLVASMKTCCGGPCMK